jgi:hypothetical protein
MEYSGGGEYSLEQFCGHRVSKQYRQCTFNVTMRRVYETIVALEKLPQV